MSLNQSIAKNTSMQIVGKAFTTVLGIVAIAIMTRYLGAEQFGWYVTANSFLQMVGIITDFGFTVTVSNLLSEPGANKPKILSTSLSWRLITAIVCNGGAPFLFLLFPYPPQIKWAGFIVAISFFAWAINQVLIGYYRAELRLGAVTVAEIVGRAGLVLGVALAAYMNATFLGVMSVISVSSLLTTIYLWWFARPLTLTIDWAISKILFTKMWPTALAVIFNSIYLQADRIILPLYVSQTQVGWYGAAYRVLDVAIQLAAIIMGIMMPVITYAWSRGLKEAFRERYQMAFDSLSLLLLPITAGTFILSGPLIQLVGGPEFAEAGFILRWLSVSILGTCFGMIFGHIVLAIDRQRQALIIYATDAVFSLIGYFYFIPLYGVRGAIGVTIFSEIYAGVFLMLLTFLVTRVQPALLTFGKILLATAGMSVVVNYLHAAPLIVSITVGAVSYTLLALLLKITSLTTIRQLLGKDKIA